MLENPDDYFLPDLPGLSYAISTFLSYIIPTDNIPRGQVVSQMVNKYVDLYKYGTSPSDNNRYIIGDATIEMKGWNSEINGSGEFIHYKDFDKIFLRGGGYYDLGNNSVFSYTCTGTGLQTSRCGFRPVFVP